VREQSAQCATGLLSKSSPRPVPLAAAPVGVFAWGERDAGRRTSAPSEDNPARVTAEEDIAIVAGQLADLTRTVGEMEAQLLELRKRADRQQERADQQRDRTEIQQERIDLAARELAEVSALLQAAADALRESV